MVVVVLRRGRWGLRRLLILGEMKVKQKCYGQNGLCDFQKFYVLSRPSRLYYLFPSPPGYIFSFFDDVGMVFFFPFKFLVWVEQSFMIITTIVVFIRLVSYSCELYLNKLLTDIVCVFSVWDTIN